MNILRKEQNLRKAAKFFYIFLTTPEEVEKYIYSNSSDKCMHYYNADILNLFDPELQLINIKPMIKKKLKELLNELKKFKFQTILVLDYKKRNDCKIFLQVLNSFLVTQTLMKHLNPCIKSL